MFRRLNRIEVTTAYPLILNFYGNYKRNKINKNDFATILKILENYLIRRFVCNIPTNQLNKIFQTIYPQIQTNYPESIIEGFKIILQGKGYPKDNDFFKNFCETSLYGSGRIIKTKLILETIESSFNHREAVPFENVTIEHIMPQTLSEWWQEHLGDDWDETHVSYLHTIGNLTLTAYNTELSNDDFYKKKEKLNESHLDLNKYFSDIHQWTKHEIEARAEILAKKALEIWSYFGQKNSTSTDISSVTGTTPVSLKILGQHIEVSPWRDVMEQTLNTIADLKPEKFEMIAHNFPRYVSKDNNKFRSSRELKNNYFIEVNLAANRIQKFCQLAIETAGLTAEDWEVTTQ